jgi:hypothetical protein
MFIKKKKNIYIRVRVYIYKDVCIHTHGHTHTHTYISTVAVPVFVPHVHRYRAVRGRVAVVRPPRQLKGRGSDVMKVGCEGRM